MRQQRLADAEPELRLGHAEIVDQPGVAARIEDRRVGELAGDQEALQPAALDGDQEVRVGLGQQPGEERLGRPRPTFAALRQKVG